MQSTYKGRLVITPFPEGWSTIQKGLHSEMHTRRFHTEGALKNFKIWIFLHLFVGFLQEAHFRRGIKQKSFQCETITIFT